MDFWDNLFLEMPLLEPPKYLVNTPRLSPQAAVEENQARSKSKLGLRISTNFEEILL